MYDVKAARSVAFEPGSEGDVVNRGNEENVFL